MRVHVLLINVSDESQLLTALLSPGFQETGNGSIPPFVGFHHILYHQHTYLIWHSALPRLHCMCLLERPTLLEQETMHVRWTGQAYESTGGTNVGIE